MMKLLLLSFILAFTFVLSDGWAQDRTVTGKVTSTDDGSSLPGVNVVVKNTTIGTVTDLDGMYTLKVPEDATVLTFSFIGMVSIDVPINARSVVNIQMEEDTKQLNEVIVTALGIERAERSLGYNVASIKAEDLTKGRERSALNALQGKVAGVNITSASGAPGSSSRVIIRGISSLTGSNQPLFVIDGVPVNNSSLNNGDVDGESLNSGADFGNRLNDIPPDDIESVSVLKTGATALYGSRGANGVIIITTKSGKRAAARGKPEITFNSSLTFDTPLRLPALQNEFGQGFFGEPDLIENTSWGPRFDGQDRVWGNVVDNQQQVKPYVALKDNVKDFFDVGKTYNSSIALAGGNEQSNYRISYSNVYADGFMPTDADSYIRNTLSVRGGAKIGNRITSSAGLNYVKKNGKFVPTGQEQSTLDNLFQTPRDISVVDHKDYNNKFNNLDNYYSFYTLNPYYVLNEHGSDYSENRLFGNVQFNYAINDYLSATLRVGSDVSDTETKRWRSITIPGGNNTPSSNEDIGRVIEDTYIYREINSDFILKFDKNLTEDLSLNALVGHNVNQRTSSRLTVEVLGLDIPGFYDISNSSATPSVKKDESIRRLYGVYSQVDLGFRDYLFLTLSARNDWSSTLPSESKSFFYPGVNASFIFSEVLALPEAVSFGKLRAAWTRTGLDALPYKIQSVFTQATHTDGFRDLSYPLEGNINGFEVSDLVGNPTLQPEISTDIELGIDLGLFNDRLNIEASYYTRKKTDLIFEANVSPSSGVRFQTLNLGEITNKGWEFLVSANPIRTSDFSWNLSANFSNNKNELTALNEALAQADLGGLSTVSYIARKGQPIGLLEGVVPKRTDDGRLIVDASGMPIAADDKEVYGDSNYDYIIGITNSLDYKGISMTALFDIRQGGVMYSRTADIAYFSGTAPETIYNDRQPFIVPNSVQEDDEGNYIENTVPITNSNLYTYWGNGGTELDRKFVIDKSFVKLRELSISYTLPRQLMSKLPFQEIQIGLIGRNLLLWTPEDNTFIDPEVTTFGNDIEAEFGEFQATPTARSMGFNLRVKF